MINRNKAGETFYYIAQQTREVSLIDNQNKNINKLEKAEEEIWLHYCNRVLFAKGVITESERNKVDSMIYSEYKVPAINNSTI